MRKSSRVDSVSCVFDDLKRKIIHNELKPDAKLPELQLCEHYGVSRLHIKEALKMLEMENLVAYVPRRGYHVVGMSFANIQEIALLRFSTDYIAVTYFAEYATEADLQKVEKLVNRTVFFCEHNRIEDAIDESKHFYQEIYEFCPFKRVNDFLSNVECYLDIIRRYDYDKEGYNLRACEALKVIIAGIREKDSSKIKAGLYARDSLIIDHLYKQVSF